MNSRQGGFTIIELLIATSVFSIILMVGIVIFLQVGSSYYKGVTITQTQDTAKQILDDVSTTIRLGNGGVVGPLTATGGAQYYCFGHHRYTFNLYKLVQSDNHDYGSKFGLVEDEPSGGGCGDPFGNPAVVLNNPSELLGNNMRVLAFSITNQGGQLYSINIKVASGADSSLTNPNSPDAQCAGGSGDQFCAITSLQTVVYEGY